MFSKSPVKSFYYMYFTYTILLSESCRVESLNNNGVAQSLFERNIKLESVCL